jgi:hypothetical protein
MLIFTQEKPWTIPPAIVTPFVRFLKMKTEEDEIVLHNVIQTISNVIFKLFMRTLNYIPDRITIIPTCSNIRDPRSDWLFNRFPHFLFEERQSPSTLGFRVVPNL